MFHNKINVDKFIRTHLQKFNTEKERNQHGYRIAKLYYACNEYELARRYVSAYLTVAPDSAVGHRLLAECLEKLNRRDAALKSYRTSFELDSSQKDLLLKVCELMAYDDVSLDQTNASWWCEKAQEHFPNHPTLFMLRERIITSENENNSGEVEKLILNELEQCPTNVELRIKLLRHFLKNNKIGDAYKHAYDVEQLKNNIFVNNLSWYETLAEIALRYQRDDYNNSSNSLNYEFWIFFTSILDKLVSLSLDDQSGKSVLDCTTAVFNFDQILSPAIENVKKCPERNLAQEFQIHYHGQLCLHFATLNFKKAKVDKISFKEASRLNIPLLLGAWSSPPAEVTAGWIDQSSEQVRKWIQRWNLEASFRASQAGHILLAILGEKRSNFSDKLAQICSGNWRERLYKMLFVNRDQLQKIKYSYFITCPQLSELRALLPASVELITYDETAQLLNPSSLHHIVWLALNSKLAEFKCNVFNGLQYSVSNLNNCAAETLNVLDVQSFIYCATACARVIYQETRASESLSSERPSILPVTITERVCTPAQENWYKAAYKVYSNTSGSELGNLRLTLTQGIETIRCVGNHGLNVNLLVLLANTFSSHEKFVKDLTKKEFVAARATLYWNNAIPLLERLKQKQVIKYPAGKKPLFDYREKEFTLTEINEHLEEGKLYLACKLKENHEFDRALEMFQDLKSPYASYYQAQIYKQLAAEQIEQNKENVTSEMRSQHIIFLSKARDCYYLTLDRLREPSVDRKHPLNSQLGTEIENIESMLSRIDPDISVAQNECENISDENVSSVGSMGDQVMQTPFYYSNGNNSRVNKSRTNHSTPFRNMPTLDPLRRTEARPSPERLEAQIRQMAITKDAIVTQILEQSHSMLDSYRTLSDEIRNLKEEFKKFIISTTDMTQKMQDDISTIKEHVIDQIPMIKKEISELKKDTTKLKSNQLNEEDLYDVLDEDYDYNVQVGTAANTFNQSPLYPGFTNRPAVNYATTAMYPGMYQAVYGYHPALPPTLPFTDSPQIPDLRSLNLTQAALTPQAAGAPLIQSVPLAQPHVPTLQSVAGLSTSTVVPPASIQLPSTLSLGATTSSLTATTSTTQISNTLINKVPPVNVVITASDPVPTTVTTVSQPVLSVTIPPQHLKGNAPKVSSQPHNYQIQLPASVQNFTSTSSIINPTSTAPFPVTTQNLLSNVAPPVYSAIPDQKSSLPKQPSFTSQANNLQRSNTSFNISNISTELNKSNASATSVEEHDPCPDFKPIIPLPDEVEVKTGEEGEDVLYKERAKLFRYVDSEWKERGVGDVKLLHNKTTNKVRLLMRRDQVHKVCANHFLSPDMELKAMSTSDRAFVWAATDFADEEMRLEKLCIRFKTPEQAKKFYDEFEKAKTLIKTTEPKIDSPKIENLTSKPVILKTPTVSVASTSAPVATATLGGFTFSTPPVFQPKKDEVKEQKVEEPTKDKTSPFAGFTFKLDQKSTANNSAPIVEFKPLRRPSEDVSAETKNQTEVKGFFSPKDANIQPFTSTPSNTPIAKVSTPQSRKENTSTDAEADEFVPTAEFNPVVPLPDLVDVKTGEEDERVLFCERAKLLRYDSSTKEWKERGLGEMKILASGIVRLLMRREQVLKVCCNHQVTKTMKFTKFASNDKAITWAARDFSEHEFKDEVFTIRFKTAEIASKFLKTLQDLQEEMDSGNFIEDKSESVNTTKSSEITPRKSKSDSWECPACFVENDNSETMCSACTTPKDEKKETKPASTVGWGDQFKPKAGSWACKSCYVNNEPLRQYCIACESPKDDTVPKKEKGINLTVDANAPKFTFGIPPASTVSTATTTSTFSITSTPEQTVSITSTLVNPNVPKFTFGIPPASTVSTATTTSTFSITSTPTTTKSNIIFGAPPSSTKPPDTKTTTTQSWGDQFKPKPGTWSCTTCYISNEPTQQHCIACNNPKDGTVPKKDSISGVTTPKFNFGIPPQTSTTTATPTTTGFSFGSSNLSSKFSFQNKGESDAKNTTSTEPKTEVLDLGAKTGFSFQFNKSTPVLAAETKPPRETNYTFGSPEKFDFSFTPRSPRKSGCEDSDGNITEDEGEHIVFTPVVPLPDKIDVKTGEEDEEVLYCHRAKLFRFVDGEWKERGIGDVKILKHKKNDKLRVVMRRDQVLKICLNHALTNDIEYRIKDDKSWLFSAADFSEGEIKHQQYCLRFKTPDIAQDFMNAINNARNQLKKAKDKEIEQSGNEDDDIIIVAPQIPKDLEEKAAKLQLPPNFYAYLDKPPCSGCIGCDPDSYDFNKKPSQTSESPKTEKTKSTFSFSESFNALTSLGTTPTKTTEPEQIKSIFGKGEVKYVFGGTLSAEPKSEVKSIFGGTPTSQSKSEVKSIFGGTPKSETKPIFGGTPSTESKTEVKSIFGGTPKSESKIEVKSIFGGTPTSESKTEVKSIFGGTPSSESKSEVKNIFGTPSTESKSIFGGVPTSESKEIKSIFGGTSNQTFDSAKFTFGGKNTSIFDGTSNSNVTSPSTATSTSGNSILKPPRFSGGATETNIFSKSVFDNKSAGNIFAPTTTSSGFTFGNVTNTQTTTIFGGSVPQKPNNVTSTTTSNELSINKPEEKPKADAKENKTEGVFGFKTDSTIVDFATLASSAENQNIKPFSAGNSTFQFEGAGTPVFASFLKSTPNKLDKSKEENESKENEATGDATEEYDPHYEPIVPLPDKIVVSTGEEDEEKLFCERAKLFRYDSTTKEWKERGVGEMKILYHPQRGTYRFVLRREQVHKLVLNQLLRPDMQINKLQTSNNAFCWAGMNHAEEGGALEELAVRFKNQQLAEQFYNTVLSCQTKLKNTLPITITSLPLDVREASSEEDDDYNEEEDYNEEADEEDDIDEEDDDDDDERSIMWEKHCTLSEEIDGTFKEIASGDIQIVYDSQTYFSRIYMANDDGETITNSPILQDTVMTCENNTCTWTAIEDMIEPSRERKLRATFESEAVAKEFYLSFKDGVEVAQ